MVKVFWARFNVIAWLVLTLTFIQLLNSATHSYLMQLGIIPRQIDTWYHIFTSPFIHGSYSHLINNLIGLSIFTALCLLTRSVQYFLKASLFIITLTGLLVWLFGRNAIHVGASGWVFGLWSLLIMQAWFDRSFKHFCIALLIVFFYGGMIYGVLPSQQGVSFEAHLFGVISGACFAARAASKKRRYKRK